MEFMVGGAPRRIEISTLVIAGWTGRDRTAVEYHIAELAAIGVRPPRVVPCFYRVGANLLTTTGEVEVVGEDSSGEVEFVLVAEPDAMYVGVGSDHTDGRSRPTASPYRSRCAPSRSAGSFGDSRKLKSI